MQVAQQIKPDVYWVGALDWNERHFHGYTTEKGITYNAYLIVDEKVTLIDTVKEKFHGELLQRVSSVIDPAKIDVVITNHVEMDHSGGLPEMAAIAPNATIVTGAPKGVAGLTAHYGEGLNLLGVKTGDTLNIGKRTLTFVQTPMVHWPDSMVTYDEYDQILFSNDSFGQLAISTKAEVLDENRQPVPGLYAGGTIANAELFYMRYAVSGASMCMGTVTGRIAAQEAMKYYGA